MIVATTALLLAAQASRIPHDPDNKPMDLDEVRRVGALFGDCVVKRRFKDAKAFVLYDPLSDRDEDKGQMRLIDRVADGDCLVQAAKARGGVEMRFPGDTMRYLLADALFRVELTDSAPFGDLKQVPLLQHPVFDASDYQPKPGRKVRPKDAAALAERRDKELSRIVFSRFGECVVRMDPMNSRRLLSAKIMTPEENAAFAALKDALSVCVPENSTVTLNKMTVRGTVAYNYYRLANAPRSAAQKEAAN